MGTLIEFGYYLKTKINISFALKNAKYLASFIRNRLKFVPLESNSEAETEVIPLEEDGKPEERVQLALKCLPQYDPAKSWMADSSEPFGYWKIRDYAYAYRSKFTTPSIVAERFISAIDGLKNKNPDPNPLLISYDPADIRKQAAASTRRFEEGNPLSVLDGIFMAIKDDIDCSPYPSNGGTTFFHEIRRVQEDAACVAKLRGCGVILVGKANMHELGLGTTGNNPNYGTARNPHAPERYTGGSSSGSAAIVAAGLCSAALGTDAGGSVRIPASLCGVVGLKSTYGRTNMTGSMYSGTVEIIGPITTSVEDAILVYTAILGSSAADRIALKPSIPHIPNLSSPESSNFFGSLKLGKYTEWINDVFSTDITIKCEDVIYLLSETHGCKTVEIVIPELHEMHTAHIVSYGSESARQLNPDLEDGKQIKFTNDTRINLSLFRSFTASDYVTAQCLRMTAPVIPLAALKSGETDLQAAGNLMRFVALANLLGLPAISVPVGYDKQGLPIGLQLIGRPWCEASILRIAAAVEELCATTKNKPLQYYDMLKGD